MELSYDDKQGLKIALDEAVKGAAEGGIPIGSCIITKVDDSLEVLAASHNQRIQKNSAILHGETAALELAGRQKAEVYRNSTIVRPLVVFSPFSQTYVSSSTQLSGNRVYDAAIDYFRNFISQPLRHVYWCYPVVQDSSGCHRRERELYRR